MWFGEERRAISFLNNKFYLDFHMADDKKASSTEPFDSSGLCTYGYE